MHRDAKLRDFWSAKIPNKSNFVRKLFLKNTNGELGRKDCSSYKFVSLNN